MKEHAKGIGCITPQEIPIEEKVMIGTRINAFEKAQWERSVKEKNKLATEG